MVETFEKFLQRREQAAQAFASGDPRPLNAIARLSGIATAFTRDGGFNNGARAVNEHNLRNVEEHAEGGTTRFEIADSGTSGDLGYWTGYQISDVVQAGTGERVPIRLRVTEVFRRTEDSWQRVHRHASEPSDV